MQNVVVVTLNYRLGLFGFLPVSVDGNGPRGNYGLMDQVAALHWVQENIGAFGGDAENVTLVGHGYGAACVNLLMISPMASTSLFSRVILMSGSALSPGAIARDADTFARLLAKSLNCPLYDNSLMVECLRSKPMHDLLAVDLKAPDYTTAFGPIIDGIVLPSEPQPLTNEANPSVIVSSSVGTPYDLLFGTSRSDTPVVLSHEERHKNAKPLPDHRNMHVGPVRQISFHFNSSPSAHNSTRSSVSQIDAKTLSPEAKQGDFSRTPPLRTGILFSTPVTSSPVLLDTQSHARPNITLYGGISRSNNHNNRSTQATPIVMESGRFGSYIIVTIVGGIVMLVINIAIFVFVYRKLHRPKDRKHSASSDEEKGEEGKYEDAVRIAHESVSADHNEMSEGAFMQPHHQLESSPRPLRHQYHIRAGTTTGGMEDDGLVLYTDLDLYASHHHHHSPDVHGSRCMNAGLINPPNAPSPSASTGTSSHHHVHFLHPHLSQVQILDSSDGLLDPQIVTSVCNNSSMFSRNSYVSS